MTTHPKTQLLQVALGTATASEDEAVRAHLEQCSDCRALLQSLIESTREGVPAVAGPELTAPVWERLRPQVEGPERFDVFVPRVAEQLALSEDDTRALLHGLDTMEWSEGPADGVEIALLPAGAEKAELISTAVRISFGSTLPRHQHAGAEQVLVLQGGYRTDEGAEFWRGDEERSEAGTSHAMTALAGPPCICVVTLSVGE